jgi:C4-dicarboxylate-specific signal transduction histidine kinase
MEVLNPSAEWLERANRLAITVRLLPNTVHDVNNALQVITGSAELLDMAAGVEEDVRKRGLAIRSHASRATTFLAELMAFVRDANERPQRLSLRAAVERAVALRHYSLTKQGIKTTVDGDAAVVANPRQLMQIALNVLINAEQALAGRPGGRIGFRMTDTAGRASLAIEDNGPGVSAEAGRRLFQPEQIGTDPHGGLGIGLCVSRTLAERNGGTLAFAPGPDGGCVFTLSLPSAPGVG